MWRNLLLLCLRLADFTPVPAFPRSMTGARRPEASSKPLPARSQLAPLEPIIEHPAPSQLGRPSVAGVVQHGDMAVQGATNAAGGRKQQAGRGGSRRVGAGNACNVAGKAVGTGAHARPASVLNIFGDVMNNPYAF
jgi:hypothetical protein